MNIPFQLRSFGRILAGMLLLALGLALSALLLVYLVRDLPIWVLGQRTTGEVVDLWVERTNDDKAEIATFQYFMRYRFTTSDGQVITRTSTVSPAEWIGVARGPRRQDGGHAAFPGGELWPKRAAAVYYDDAPISGIAGGLERGSPVEITYFRLYPAYNRLDESRLVPVLACAYLPLALLAWAGLAAGRHLIQPASARVKRWCLVVLTVPLLITCVAGLLSLISGGVDRGSPAQNGHFPSEPGASERGAAPDTPQPPTEQVSVVTRFHSAASLFGGDLTITPVYRASRLTLTIASPGHPEGRFERLEPGDTVVYRGYEVRFLGYSVDSAGYTSGAELLATPLKE